VRERNKEREREKQTERGGEIFTRKQIAEYVSDTYLTSLSLITGDHTRRSTR
jgi:hypothetical protein